MRDLMFRSLAVAAWSRDRAPGFARRIEFMNSVAPKGDGRAEALPHMILHRFLWSRLDQVELARSC